MPPQDAPRYWKIGQLAARTGLTVRALRHYDQIGLLRPARRSPAGYRLYGEADVARLQQVQSLRQLGLSLAQIQACLDGGRLSLNDAIGLHLQRVRAQIALQQKLQRRLEAIFKALQTQRGVTVERLLETIEVIQMMEKHGFDPKFSDEEMQQIKRQGQTLGQDKIHQVEREWPELIAKVQAEMDQGTPPSHERVQKLARRWGELVQMFSGGNPNIEGKLAKAYREAPKFGAQLGLTPELMAYVQKASQ